jgi:uncharacterized membrane protein
MVNLIVTFHLIAMAAALGGRLIYIPLMNQRVRDGLNERLDELQDVFMISRWADVGLIVSFITGMTLFLMQGISLGESHWSFKLKLVTLLLLVTDIGAFHVAAMRVTNHYDAQMIPALKRLNTLAVLLMSCMVLFAAFAR